MEEGNVIEGNVEDEGVIPAAKIQEAHAVCMQDPKLAKYFNDAPYGAKQYIALMFYCTVFSEEVDDDLCAKYQQEVEEDLSCEDALYLATRDANPITKAHFRELYLLLKKKDDKAPEKTTEAGVVEKPDSAPDLAVVLALVERGQNGLRAEIRQIRLFLLMIFVGGLVLGVLGLAMGLVAIVH